ncbi:hypothetical protein MKX01_007716 [Papaver californicum]|nr:hypothetical protein MKX01_007716 [Papaver californicum]
MILIENKEVSVNDLLPVSAAVLQFPGNLAYGETLVRGTLKGHDDMVTAIACPIDNSDMIVSSSRDKSILVWSLTKQGENYGIHNRRLTGHGHFVQDVILSSDGQFGLYGSWDSELRLWDLNTGDTTRRFVGHTKDVLFVSLSMDHRHIISVSRDRSIKLWNTLGECKYPIQDGDSHTNWVSCVRFSPNTFQPTIVSASWDKIVKVWNLTNCKLRNTLAGHGGYVNIVVVSPDGSLCASGGKDGVTLLWDLAEDLFLPLPAHMCLFCPFTEFGRFTTCSGKFPTPFYSYFYIVNLSHSHHGFFFMLSNTE